MVQWQYSSPALARRQATQNAASSTRIDDFAARTADQASELYSRFERESRTRRFARVIERAGHAV